MPVSFIKDALLSKLSELDYKAQDINEPCAKETFKEVVLSGEKCEISLFSDREFEVKIAEATYFRAVATDFWFSHQKVIEQSKFFSASAAKVIPIPWLLVSAYYSAFYSAVELSKLYGLYSLYLKKDHCDRILRHANGDKLDKGNYIGKVNTNVTDYITIRFTSLTNSPPHDLAWKNIVQIINHHKVCDIRETKVAFYKLIRSIIDSSSKDIQTPNNVRNDWNYSFANAYDEDFCMDMNDVKGYLISGSPSSIMSWPKNYKRLSRKQNDAYSMLYIEAILRQVMRDFRGKLFK